MASRGFDRLTEWLRYLDRIEDECPNCASGTFVLARACADCGAALRLRRAGMVVAGALVLLLVAVMVAAAALIGWHRLAAATDTGAAADAQIAASSTADFGWLSTAMNGCDAQAKTDTGTLHFLVTPLVSAAKDIAAWRAKSINDSGNGILLRSDDTLDGLKNAALRIYPADYEFSISDEASDTVYKWRAAMGVAKFSTPDTGSLATFKVQFGTARSADQGGGSFRRLIGSCHWVNMIIGN
jgi:hypothetical protein